ncbi:MAG: hypothetical protein KDA96_07120, partial [Planctomycetaceae bacterium]|nr:hypothetical protein [Planctomycetaceae bacterium]
MSGWDYFWRGVQVVGGAAEVVGGGVIAGVGALGAPVTGGTSLIATVGGAAIGAHGMDQIWAGLSGNPSVASQLGGYAADAAGLPTWVGEIAGDIGPGFAGLASQIRNLPKLVTNLSKATGPALAKAVSILRDKGALKAVLSKLSPSKLKEMLKNKLITKDELREAGIDPDSLDAGAKTSVALRKALSLA